MLWWPSGGRWWLTERSARRAQLITPRRARLGKTRSAPKRVAIYVKTSKCSDIVLHTLSIRHPSYRALNLNTKTGHYTTRIYGQQYITTAFTSNFNGMSKHCKNDNQYAVPPTPSEVRSTTPKIQSKQANKTFRLLSRQQPFLVTHSANPYLARPTVHPRISSTIHTNQVQYKRTCARAESATP